MIIKLIVAAVIVVIVALGLGLWVKGKDTVTVTSEIVINSSPTKVWTVLANIIEWQAWSSAISKSSGDLAEGSQLEITMRAEKGSDGPQYSPVITGLLPNKKLNWRATMGAGFIFTNDKKIELVPTNGGTKVIHQELFSGMMAAMFGKKEQQGVLDILNEFNQGLKLKAEQSL